MNPMKYQAYFDANVGQAAEVIHADNPAAALAIALDMIYAPDQSSQLDFDTSGGLEVNRISIWSVTEGRTQPAKREHVGWLSPEERLRPYAPAFLDCLEKIITGYGEALPEHLVAEARAIIFMVKE